MDDIPQLPLSNNSVPDGRYRSGRDIVLVLDGERYSLAPLELSDFDEIEEHYRQHRKPGVAAIQAVMPQLADAPADIREAMMDRLYRELKIGTDVAEIPRTELAAWMDTREGLIASMLIQFRKRHPDITPARVRQLLSRMQLAEALKLRDQSCQQLRDITDQLSQPQQNGK